MELSSSSIKKILIFSYISGNGNPKKIIYISGNRNHEKLLKFQEMKLFPQRNLIKLFKTSGSKKLSKTIKLP